MKRRLLMIAALAFVASPCGAAVLTLDDNGVHNFPPLFTVAPGNVFVRNDTTVNVFDTGDIQGSLGGSQTATINVFGGSILADLAGADDTEISLSGGSVGINFVLLDNAQGTISGGTIGNNIGVNFDSNLTIFGVFNFAPGVYGDGSPLDEAILTGNLADGTAINNQVIIRGNGLVTLVPEPCTLTMYALGLLGLGLYVHRRRRPVRASEGQ